ncbi:hypothetical protein TNCV_3819671 [Trichonephila clavipes]|nr:hypothetical protein TNCV_3819671 [Trichonephila clavipes]
MVSNDAKMVAKVTKLAANLDSKKDANLALTPQFRQVNIELPLYRVTGTSRNITARVIERDTSEEIHYSLENSRGFRTRQHGVQ